MAIKIQIIGSALVCTNTDTSDIIISQPSKDVWYKEDQLQTLSRIAFYDSNGIKGAGIYTDEMPPFELSEAIDENDVAFNIVTFREFATNFLGYDAVGQQQALSSSTGWAEYRDTTYVTGSPFSLLASTITNLPNNAGSIIQDQKPVDVTTFYNGSIITGRSGDGILITIDFIITPTQPATTYAEVWLDITGGTGTPTNFANLYKHIITFPKGTGTERPISIVIGGYTKATWETNGAVVKVLANGTAEIKDIRYVITRTHKAR